MGSGCCSGDWFVRVLAFELAQVCDQALDGLNVLFVRKQRFESRVVLRDVA